MQPRDAAQDASPGLTPWFWPAALAFVALVGLAAAHHDSLRHVFDGAPPALQWFRYRVVRPFHHSITHGFLHPVFFLLFPLVLLLEWRMPARPQQGIFSVALAHDALYVPTLAVLRTVLFLGFFELLDALYVRHLGFLTVESVRELPQGVRVLWGFVLADFLLWSQHRLKHAVPWLWQFHAVHHAQRDLNLFSDDRSHVLDFFSQYLVLFLPMRILCADRPEIALLSLALTWHARFSHSNVRTNLGPLRHLFVTPQLHRIHHSIEPEHRDRNFGAHLSVWDRLFGTHHEPGRDEYPATGIPDPSFPREQDAEGLRFLLTPLAQHVHPLWVLARRLAPARAPRLPVV